LDHLKTYVNSKNQSEIKDIYLNHFEQTYLAMKFSSRLEILDYIEPALPKLVQNKKTIVFDLDETLIHCNENDEPSDTTV